MLAQVESRERGGICSLLPSVGINGWPVQVDRLGLVRCRTSITDPPSEAEIRVAMRWLERAPKIKTANVGSDHVGWTIERKTGKTTSNGAVIIAAHRLGIPIACKRIRYATTAKLGISMKWYSDQLKGDWFESTEPNQRTSLAIQATRVPIPADSLLAELRRRFNGRADQCQ